MRIWAKIALGLVGVSAGFSVIGLMLPDNPRVDAAIAAAHAKQEAATRARDAEVKREAWRDANIALAEKQIRGVLKDPDSAMFRNTVVIAPSEKQVAANETGVVCGEVDLPLTFHPVAIRASAVDTPSGAG